MSDEKDPGGFPPPPPQPAWEELPPATQTGGGTGGGWPQPPGGQPGDGATAPQGWGAPPPGGPPPSGGGWGQHGPAPAPPSRPRGTAPVWVVVVVGVVAFISGGVLGAIGGFVAGGVGAMGGFDLEGHSVGPDAATSQGPAHQGSFQVGQFEVTVHDIAPDFADDFEVYAEVINRGTSYPGGAIEILIRQGPDEVGRVSSALPPIARDESAGVNLFGFSDYTDDFDTLEIRID